MLEKAHNLNKSSPFIALRLANIYEAKGDSESALRILKQTLEYIPGDKDINYSYATFLMKKNPTNYKDSIYYLKKSFTEGDNRYQAQFWCARALYLSNEIEEGKKIFKRLSTLAIDPTIKRSPIGMVFENNSPQIFKGRIKVIEASYGFIAREVYGDDIFIYRYENNEAWDQLKTTKPVQFNLAFNYKGPVALNVKV